MVAVPIVRLIAGLGNPGSEYENTRHNAGFMAIDCLRDNLRGTFQEDSRAGAKLWRGRCKGQELILLKPMTFMNRSGDAIGQICRKNNISADELLVVFDDLDLPLGRIRLRQGGGDGGHRGVMSIIEAMAMDSFMRLRIGIGRSAQAEDTSADHVLSVFSDEEGTIRDRVIRASADAANMVIHRGIQEAMNRYNGNWYGTDSDPEQKQNTATKETAP